MSEREFLAFIRAVIRGDVDQVRTRLRAHPELAKIAAARGAERAAPAYFFKDISHYLYAGDTALHMAAAAFQRTVAGLLVASGADHAARNRRGAQPLHYAADTNHRQPSAQADTIAYLLSIGADPNALDKSGVAPLHRAVRTRSSAAVRALLDGGADPALANRTGSTPLDLAARTTGRGGSGSAVAKAEQTAIRQLLTARLTIAG